MLFLSLMDMIVTKLGLSAKYKPDILQLEIL